MIQSGQHLFFSIKFRDRECVWDIAEITYLEEITMLNKNEFEGEANISKEIYRLVFKTKVWAKSADLGKCKISEMALDGTRDEKK